MTLFSFIRFLLSEEDWRYREGRYRAGEVGQQAAGYGVARVLDIHASEIDRQHVERRVRRALQYAA